eukprot:23305-Rhodomonas_salina.3
MAAQCEAAACVSERAGYSCMLGTVASRARQAYRGGYGRGMGWVGSYRAREINILEDALGGAELGGELEGREGAELDRLLVDDNHLAGLHVAHILRLAQIQRARLRGHHVSVCAVGPPPDPALRPV